MPLYVHVSVDAKQFMEGLMDIFMHVKKKYCTA